MEYNIFSFPEQQIPNASKTKKWRKRHLDFAESLNSMNEGAIRQDVYTKKINLDLTLGKIHMKDLQLVVNPDGIQAGYIPENIQHYPIINGKLNLLIGEESKRPFDYSVVVTNPTSITQIERDKKAAVFQSLQQWVQQEFQDEQQQQQELERINKYYTYEYQDYREKRANEYLNHFYQEQDFPAIFNDGFRDGVTLAEEIYMCDIVSGEPVLMKLNPFEVQIYMSGFSDKIEDAEIITITQYWPIGKIYDRYFSDVDFAKASKRLERSVKDFDGSGVTEMGENDYRPAYVRTDSVFDDVPDGFDPTFGYTGTTDVTQPVDQFGNIRVIRMFWKSRRKIKQVKKYDPMTGQETYEWYSDQYIADEDNGEEVNVFWINEAWEGTKIGKDIYVGMGPRPIQYSNMTNPSVCHFGIIGQIYAFNGHKPYSLVDMMKPYNYMYDMVSDRLSKAIASDWGSMMRLDLAKKPKNWKVEDWLYFAKVNHLYVEDSFNESEYGRNTGVMAGGMNNNTQSLMSSNTGAYIQQLTNLLEFVQLKMSEVVGITKQREGQISNRETVGGVERSTLQSSHITEWVFNLHNQCRKRVLECFLETAKYAARQREDKTIKFSYMSSDTSQKVVEIDADEFCESDYGIVLKNDSSQEQIQKLDMLVQAGLQNQMISFSTAMKIFQTCSFSEKIRMIEQSENEAQQRAEQMQQQQQQMQQQQIEAQAQAEQMKMQHETELNERDNETKIMVAQIQAESKAYTMQDNTPELEMKSEELLEKMRQFDQKMQLENQKLVEQRRLENEKLQHQKDVDRQKIRLDEKKIQNDKIKKQNQNKK